MNIYACCVRVSSWQNAAVLGFEFDKNCFVDGENKAEALKVYIAMSGKISPDRITSNRRVCCRCQKEFSVDVEGNYARDEECLYHWGKAFSRRVAGEGISAKRTCCSDDSSSRGCCVAKFHVTDTIPSLSGFAASVDIKPVKPEDRFRVYAVDCEMIYTAVGIELARITIVDRRLNVVYETLVKPKNKIVDCNTRFSGLKPEHFYVPEGGKPMKTIENVHKDLLGPGGLINEDTILIGHFAGIGFVGDEADSSEYCGYFDRFSTQTRLSLQKGYVA